MWNLDREISGKEYWILDFTTPLPRDPIPIVARGLLNIGRNIYNANIRAQTSKCPPLTFSRIFAIMYLEG